MPKLILAPALAAALSLSACGSLQIARITSDPTAFRNRTVSVTGTVTTGVGLLGRGGYQIEDQTGRIYVISTSGVPARGARVKVTGTVLDGANVLGTPVATAIREQHHKVER
jgi:hypothetical protein